MKAVLHFRASRGLREWLAALRPDWLEVAVLAEADRAGLAAALGEAEVLLHVLEPVTAAHLAGAPRLRLIQKLGVGVNTIDLDAARARGIAVANMPGTNTRAVAEMTLMLMLAALRRASHLDRLTRAGQGWSADADLFDGVGELAGRTVGLVGYGAVVRRLAPVLAALGTRLLYTARAPKPDAIAEWRPLDALLAEADVVSLHLPLTPETERLIDARRLALMRPGAVLVNTARGGLVDEAALVAALREGRLRAAGLDVFAREPAEAANPLFALDNVVLAPHVAWLTPETWQRSLAVAFENCRRLRAGEPLLNRVA
ncbi:MAG: hydroxyacid dehydrogenase [Rhodospirillaceae bacterium]|nr:hydroxyacid dehydrogenase [Rhodospirillaceae bacterium]